MIGYIDLDKNDGQAVHLRESINNLRKLNNEIILLCPRFKQKYTVNCSNIIDIPEIKNRQIINLIIFQYLYCIVMILHILRHKTDIIYIRHAQFNILPILTSRLLKIPCILEVNYSTEELEMTNIPKIIIYLIMIIDKISFNLANYIITVTDDLKNHIYNTYNVDKIFVIPNGADIYKFRPIENTKDVFKIDKDFKYICFVGNIERWQGLDYLVKSSHIVLKECPNTKFLIIGQGKFLKNIIDLTEELGVKDNFLFFNDVPHEKVPIYINLSDICVAPFYKGRIASPIKIYEYMACGKPVIASNISDIGNLLKKSVAGISVPPNDHMLLADSIIKLLKDEKLRIAMGKNGRKYITENYTWEITAKKILNVCDIAIGKKLRMRV